jgi:hypothetical protein
MEDDKIVFVTRVSRFGAAKQLLIYIPKAVKALLHFGKEYKVTLEETEEEKETA